MHLLVPNKNLNSLKSGLIDSNQLSQNFIWKNQTALQEIFAKNQVSFLYILNNMIMLLFSIMFVCFYGAMAQWLGPWIPIRGILSSKPLGGSKFDSAFNPSKVEQMSTRTSWNLVLKKKLSPCNSPVALKQLNTIHKKGP